MTAEMFKGKEKNTDQEGIEQTPIPPARTFRVRRYPIWFAHGTVGKWLTEEDLTVLGIEAHRFLFSAHGDLIFDIIVDINIPANLVQYHTVAVIPSGTYYDMHEVSNEFNTKSTN